MLKVYSSYNCSSCKKATKWLEKNGLIFEEINFFGRGLTYEDVLFILKYTENGFYDIISERSKVYSKHKKEIEEMKTKELINFIIENPSILKRPIIVDDVTKTIQTGFNEVAMEELI